jgi:L-iditol 2-dehydrogenase
MKAALLTGIRQFEIRDIPTPKITRDSDVLVRVTTVGVCGSDIHYFTEGRIGDQVVEFPFLGGHEAAGVVEQTGKSVSRVSPGDRIAIDPNVYCGQCDQCRSGRENTCRELKFLGCPGQLDGCLCEYVVIDERCCYPVPDHMSAEEATLSEPLAIAVYAVDRTLGTTGLSTGILGLGPIGLSVFHILRARKAGRIFVTDKIPARLEKAAGLKPIWTGNPDTSNVVEEILSREPLGLDLVYECSGDPPALAQAVRLCKPGGLLVIVGIPETDEITFPIHDLRRTEITIFNIRRQADCTQKAIDLIADNEVSISDMVTHRFPLDRTGEAYDLVASYGDGVMKAMIAISR